MTDQLPEANPLTKAMREYADEIDGIPMSEERTKTMRVRLANVAAAFMRSAAVEIDDLRRAHLSCSTITNEQVEAALLKLIDLCGPPHMARVEDYLTRGSSGQRQQELEMLRLADEEARNSNQAIVREILEAAARVKGTE